MIDTTGQQALKPNFEAIPSILAALPSWVGWRYQERDGKATKPPLNARTGKLASCNDPSTWSDFETARKAYGAGGYHGIGIVIPEGAGVVGVDLDKCRNPESGALDLWASEIVEALQSYTEVSPSGRGIRIFVKGQKSIADCRTGRFECYDKPGTRYLTLTGRILEGTPATIEPRQSQLDAILQRVFVKKDLLPEHVEKASVEPSKAAKSPQQEPTEREHDLSGILRSLPARAQQDHRLPNEELLKIALRDSKFSSLWNGQGGPDDSANDLALCNKLAFYFGPDEATIDQMFRQSGLMRDKWNRQDYRQKTIHKGIEGCNGGVFGSSGYGLNSADSRINSAVNSAVSSKNDENTSIHRGLNSIEINSAVSAVRISEFENEIPDPIPFEDAKIPPPPVDLLPSWLADMVKAVADQALIPADLAFGAALGALSTACGAGFVAESLDGFQAQMGLYIGLVASSAEGKSQALKPFKAPFLEQEEAAKAERAKDASTRKAKISVLKSKRETIEKDAKKPGGNAPSEESIIKGLAAIEQELEELELPPARLLIDNCTMEELDYLLSKNRHISSLSSEGGLFTLAAGLYSKGSANIDGLLKAYDGESYSVDRRISTSVFISKPSLTLCLGIQPSKLRDIAKNKEFAGRGLLNRFLYVCPDSRIGTKDFFTAKPILPAVRAVYSEKIKNILDYKAQRVAPAVMCLSREAQHFYTTWRNGLDRRCANDLTDIKEWGCKLMDTALRLAGLLHVGVSLSPCGISAEIDLDTMQKAIKLIDGYLIPHGKRAWFDGMFEDALQEKAKAIFEWALKRKSPFKARDVLSILRKSVPDTATFESAVKILEERFLVTKEVQHRSGRGQPPAPIFKLNSKFLLLDPHSRNSRIQKNDVSVSMDTALEATSEPYSRIPAELQRNSESVAVFEERQTDAKELEAAIHEDSGYVSGSVQTAVLTADSGIRETNSGIQETEQRNSEPTEERVKTIVVRAKNSSALKPKAKDSGQREKVADSRNKKVLTAETAEFISADPGKVEDDFEEVLI